MLLQNVVIISNQKIFYQKIGKGPVLLFFHPSPRSSNFMLPLMQLLQDHFTCIAIDTPGYGKSQPLNISINNIYDYLPVIFSFTNTVTATNEKIYIYGSATGAQLGVAFALQYPQKINYLFVDNAAHFSEDERQEILLNYFPKFNFENRELIQIQLKNFVEASCLYFPWYNQNIANKIADELPPSNILDEIIADYLNAGEKYSIGYKVAFEHEKQENVLNLQTNTIIFKWLGSPILKFINALTNTISQKNIAIIETPVDVMLRYEIMKNTILQKIDNV